MNALPGHTSQSQDRMHVTLLQLEIMSHHQHLQHRLSAALEHTRVELVKQGALTRLQGTGAKVLEVTGKRPTSLVTPYLG